MRRIALTTLCLAALVHSSAYAWPWSPRPLGSLRIQVVDSEGRVQPEARVYVYGRGTRGLQPLHDGDVVNLASGDYQLVSSWVERSGKDFTRHQSPLAHVYVAAGDQVSVVLPLTPVFSTHKARVHSFLTIRGSFEDVQESSQSTSPSQSQKKSSAVYAA